MKNDTLPATDHLKVFNREQEPPPVPPRQYPVHLPTVVIQVKGGCVVGIACDWPVRCITVDQDGEYTMDVPEYGGANVSYPVPERHPDLVRRVAEACDAHFTLPPG